MEWKKVTDRDYVAKEGDFVFRLHEIDIGVYSMGEAWVLQVRRNDESEFKSLGVAFWTVSDGGYETWRQKSVDRKLWKVGREMFKRAEEILKGFGYL